MKKTFKNDEIILIDITERNVASQSDGVTHDREKDSLFIVIHQECIHVDTN